MPKGVSGSELVSRNGDTAEKVVYFPSCIARSMRPGRNDPVKESIPAVTVRLLEKAGYSNSRTCEIGCATHIGIPYMSIMYLVDEVSRPKEEI